MTNPNESTTVSFRQLPKKARIGDHITTKYSKQREVFIRFVQPTPYADFPKTDGEYMAEGISAQNRGYLNAYGSLKFLNFNDLVRF